MKFRCTRKHKACGGFAKCDVPDSQNHHHVATGATAVSQPEVIRRGSNRLIVVKERQPTLNGERCGRLWLISDVFVMFWISLYRFVLLRSDWESV